MPNLNDYLAWRGDLSMESAPLCEVDNLVFSLISYIDWDGIVPAPGEGTVTIREAAKEYFFTHACQPPRPLGLIIPAGLVTLFRAIADTPRYAALEIGGYVNEICEEREMQFSAVTIRLPDECFFVAFRGTDDTIVGWREDFNLSFLDSVPSQCRAVEYLDALDLPPDSGLYVGGHSKGGNLAVWGAIHASEKTKRHILRAWSNDGPGFPEGMTDAEHYRDMADRICILLPEESLIGLLFEHDETFDVVKSTHRGLLQHDALTWEICGDRFVRCEGLSPRALRSDAVIRDRISAMSREEKETLVRLIFDALESTGAKTLTDLSRSSFRTLKALLRSITALSGEQQESGIYLLRKLIWAKEQAEKTDESRAAPPAKKEPPRPAPKPMPRAVPTKPPRVRAKKAPIRVEFGLRIR